MYNQLENSLQLFLLKCDHFCMTPISLIFILTGDFFPPAFNCPHETERIGALGDGGKWVCGLSRLADKPDCVVYAFGIDWDSSFEAELLQRTRHCEIWGYDYTVKSFGSQIPRSDRHRTHFAKVGLGAADSHDKGDDPKLWTLKSLMKANGERQVVCK